MELSDEQISRIWDAHTVPVFGKTGINPIVFARAIEAEVHKQDTELIRHMRDALKPLHGAKLANGCYADMDCKITFALVAANARLDNK